MSRIKQTAAITDWYPKTVYLQYLNTCGASRKPLSEEASLQVSFDPDDMGQGLSFTALDLNSKQVMTIDPSGLVQCFELHKVA